MRKKQQAADGEHRAALYLRVSTAEQATYGVSLQAQEERLRAYAAAHGLEVVALKLDRLFRNAVDVLTTVQDWDRHIVDLGGTAINTRTAIGVSSSLCLPGSPSWRGT